MVRTGRSLCLGANSRRRSGNECHTRRVSPHGSLLTPAARPIQSPVADLVMASWNVLALTLMLKFVLAKHKHDGWQG